MTMLSVRGMVSASALTPNSDLAVDAVTKELTGLVRHLHDLGDVDWLTLQIRSQPVDTKIIGPHGIEIQMTAEEAQR